MKQSTKRVGKFYIPVILAESYPDDIKRIMGECFIFRCELLYHKNEFEYYAESDYFEELEEGALVPTYVWRRNKDGRIDFELHAEKLE